MNKKIIEYGTQHKVKVVQASAQLITVVDQNNEGYLLIGHGMIELPGLGEIGTITFTKSNTPLNGYWAYEKII